MKDHRLNTDNRNVHEHCTLIAIANVRQLFFFFFSSRKLNLFFKKKLFDQKKSKEDEKKWKEKRASKTKSM